jgi:FKBP-type peptidyl-prolyl cis-trans isomerase
MSGAKSRKETVEEGKAFLTKNKALPGVKVTASGLHYEVLRAGEGPSPKGRDSVKVHYVGTLIDGAKFDSSYDRREPIVFPVNGVIEGWVEGLQLMNAGSKFRFVIPSELAYGEAGAGDDIGPDAVLVFEVELLEIIGR